MFYAGELEKSRITKPGSNVAKGAKAARLQRNKMVVDLWISFILFPRFNAIVPYYIYWLLQIRDQKRAAILKEKRASSGSTSPPRVIVSILYINYL